MPHLTTLISVAAYSDSPRLRVLFSDLQKVLVLAENQVMVLVVFDRPYNDKFAYYRDFAQKENFKVVFKKRNLGETNSVNQSVQFAKKNKMEFFVHLDEDIEIDPKNFIGVITELKNSRKLKIVSAKMVRQTAGGNILLRRISAAFVKIQSYYQEYEHFVDGRFFAARIKGFPAIPENIHNDHFLTLFFLPKQLAISKKVTAEFVASRDFGSYFRCHFKYRINEMKIRYSFPQLYARQEKLCAARCGAKITGPPKAILKEIYKNIGFYDKLFHILDRFFAWSIKSLAHFVFLVSPKKFLSSRGWKVEFDQKQVFCS